VVKQRSTSLVEEPRPFTNELYFKKRGFFFKKKEGKRRRKYEYLPEWMNLNLFAWPLLIQDIRYL
jgi:hypothetical protein